MAFTASLLALPPGLVRAQDAAKTPVAASRVPSGQDNLSFRNEINHAIDRGLEWMTRNQNAAGWWSTPAHPAITALAVTAFNGDPQNRFRGKENPGLKKAYEFILGCAQGDGSIRGTNLFTYNTALSIMALVTSNNPDYDPVIRKARQFLVSVQNDLGEKGVADTPHDGGFGYGTPGAERSDMANTLFALEAIYYSERVAADQPKLAGSGLNWQAAIKFIETCQNVPERNKEPWVSTRPEDYGGFVYNPGRSDAGKDTNAVTGKISLRSYGSISYSGLLSYLYADLKRDDPRVKAVAEWLAKNYSLEENPGMGQQGLYYYYHTMAKALNTAGVSNLELAGGKAANWRFDLAMKLMALQKQDGSWANENPRWMEKDPALATSYVLLALEILSRGMEG